MTRTGTALGISVLLLGLGLPLQAGEREMATVESAGEVVQGLSKVPLQCIPPALMRDAKAVAIIPNVIKVGLLVDGRFGRGLLMVRQPDGTWSEPVFMTLTGGGVGLQVGVQATDLVLVFKSAKGVDAVLKRRGQLTLGGDLAVAAGPVGREAAAATDLQLKAEIYSYSRSRGLFAGVSLEGAGLKIDPDANEAFYRVLGIKPRDILAIRGQSPPAVEMLKDQLNRISGVMGPILAPGPVIMPPVPLPPPEPVPPPVM
jgi:lipid-binding SYLF domain-containing protein